VENGCGTAHIRGMETSVGKVLAVIMSVATAVAAALTVAHVAHYDFGFSSHEIRTPAITGAIVIGALLAVEHFGKNLRKPK
jgi:hypothetical protein